jgi:hypothetical protein
MMATYKPAAARGGESASISRHIVSVGFELEGGMDREELLRLERFVDDNGLGSYYARDVESGLCVKKFHGDLELKLHSRKMEVLAGFLDYAYNECGFETNFNCGFHVHMRFEDMPGAVVFFSSPSVVAQFKRDYSERFDGNEKYLARLGSVHCRNDNVDTELFGRILRDGRHRIPYNKNSVIALDAYKRRGNVEFRVLPNQTSSEEAIESLGWIIETADRIYGARGGVAHDSVLTREMVERDRSLTGMLR